MTSFVSSKVLDAAKQLKKEQRRAMREEILTEAKESFERAKKRQELKRERGDDQWMAPGVSERLGLGEGGTPERKKAKKKHKKERKKRKKGTHKHTRRDDDDTSSSETDSAAEGMWVEAGAEGPAKEKDLMAASGEEEDSALPASLKREDWMTMPLAPSATSMAMLTARRGTETEREREREKKSAEELVSLDKPGQHHRELNPYWKDGGKGLPPEKEASSASERRGNDVKEKPRKIGDGGRSWMLRAYKRALEQAESEGRSLEEIATERWGSLEKLQSLLRTAGINPTNPDAPLSSGRKEYLYSRPRDEEERQRRRRREEDHRVGREREERWRERGDRGGRREDGDSYGGRRERGGWREEGRDGRTSRTNIGGFLKPGESGDLDTNRFAGLTTSSTSQAASPSGNWRKKRASEPLHHNSSGSKQRSPSPDEKPTSSRSPARERSPPPSPPPAENQTDDNRVQTEPITDTQLNALGAKLMKAEMMGNSEKAGKLRKELDSLRQLKAEQERGGKFEGGRGAESRGGASGREEKTLILTKTDRFGRVKPLEFPSSSRAGPSKTPTHNKKGKREKYFADDDQYSLKALVEQERMSTAEETHAAIARMASKFVPASNADETVDDVIDSKSATRVSSAREEERQRQQAMRESRKMAEVLENCRFCVDSPQFSKHLLIAIGINVYLTVPAHQSLTPGHCLLVPTEHAMCSMGLDENVWSEIQVFQKGLTHMFAAHGMDAVFMETYTSTRRKSHMFVECISVPKDEGELLPMYFKKAILECDEEWAQNKKLIDTRQKGVRSSVPVGLPYFFVEFGLDGGYAHVIEDQAKFPHYFGREVIGGLLDLEPRLWLKPPKESFERQKEKVLKLSEWWKPYDWTQKIKT